ncbi:MAG: DUF1232 domain-containing protein [Desulfobacula sp.]|nr:DUF1232 domain-containing protein [Desulfobacula sp.]
MSQKDYSTDYSDEKFWDKIVKLPGTAGCSILRTSITLYILLREPTVPVWAKTIIIAALGYFICPIDAVPDFLPGGYIEDAMLLSVICANCYGFINKNIQKKVDKLLPKHCRDAPIVEPTIE